MAEKISKHARVISNSMKFLDGVDENFSDPKYIPESIQSSINNYVRTSRNTFDVLTSAEYQYDKASDEHISIKKEKEHIAKSFITIKNQVDKYKRGIVEFKNAVPQMNKGTQDSNYFISSAINGNQWDELHIDKNGNFNLKAPPILPGFVLIVASPSSFAFTWVTTSNGIAVKKSTIETSPEIGGVVVLSIHCAES